MHALALLAQLGQQLVELLQQVQIFDLFSGLVGPAGALPVVKVFVDGGNQPFGVGADRVCGCGGVVLEEQGHEVGNGGEVCSLGRLGAVQTHRHIAGVLETENNGVAGLGELGAVVSAEAFTVDGHV